MYKKIYEVKLKKVKLLLMTPLLMVFFFSTSVFAQSISILTDDPASVEFLEAFSKASGVLSTHTVNDNTAHQATVRQLLRTPKAPAVFKWWNYYKMTDLIEADLLEDITDIYDARVKSGDMPAGLKSTLGTVPFDGRVFAIPTSINTFVVFYNVKVFKKYGLEAPKTWEDLWHVAATLKANGVTPFGFPLIEQKLWAGGLMWTELFIRDDPETYDKLTIGEASFDHPSVVRATELWAKMNKWGYFYDHSIAWNDNMKAFGEGKFGMFYVGDWANGIFINSGIKPHEEYDMFVLPGKTEAGAKAMILEIGPYLLGKNTAADKKAQGRKWADFFMSKEGGDVWADVIKRPFPHRKVSGDKLSSVIRGVQSDAKQGKYKFYRRYFEGTPTELADHIGGELMVKIALNPDDWREILQEAKTFADNYWRQHGK